MAATTDARPQIGRARRTAFTVLAAILTVLFGLTFVAVTALTIGVWLQQAGNTDTTPVSDLAFFALGGLIVTGGLATQLRHEPPIAGLLQAVAGLLALAVAGFLGSRIEPLSGGLLGLMLGILLALLHPARGELLRWRRPSLPLAAMPAMAAVPAVFYAARMLAMARDAGPSCFMGQCARGDRFAEMAAVAIAVVLVSTLAAFRPKGWRAAARCAAGAAALVGLASIALPAASGSLGIAWGALAVAWGVGLAILAEREARRA